MELVVRGILFLTFLGAVLDFAVLAAPQQLPDHRVVYSRQIRKVRSAQSAGRSIRRRWFVDSEPVDRPEAKYCELPAMHQDNLGPSDDTEKPLYDDCWNLGISLSMNPSKFTIGDWAGTDGCGTVKTNGTCGICVGRLDGKDDDAV